MRVLHISTGDSTGAGLCALRISESLSLEGVDSKLLVLCKKSCLNNVIGIYGKKRMFFHDAYHKLLRLFNIFIYEEDKLIKMSLEQGASYTRPITKLDISNHPLVEWADVIHLHWVDNFFDQKIFLERVKKPIVWTLHDEGFFYGISHYHDCFNLDNPLEDKYYRIKKDMFSKRDDLSIVFLSRFFEDRFKKHPFVQGKNISVINNSVNPAVFFPQDRELARKELKLDNNIILLSFVAGRIDDVHKGLLILLKAVELINNDNIKILAIGGNSEAIKNERIISTGLIRDTSSLSHLLSASDFFVMPSLQEAFSQAPLEAMACGVPAIVFPVSGTEELVNSTNGVICEGFEVNDLVKGLKQAFSIKYDRVKIREDVVNRFSQGVMAHKYLKKYQNCIKYVY